MMTMLPCQLLERTGVNKNNRSKLYCLFQLDAIYLPCNEECRVRLLRTAQFIPHKRDPYIFRLTYVAILREYKHS